MVYITFSWDDGAVEDLKLMDLSLNYNVPGIFFIPAINSERGVLSKGNIKLLAHNNFEIGAHTYSHCYLTHLPFNKANEEMLEGKDFLEQLTGNGVQHFCFPGGQYNSRLVDASKKYFMSARSAATGALFVNNSYLVKPSFHFFDRGKKSLLYNSLKNKSPLFRLVLKNILISDYFDLINKVLEELSNSTDENKVIIWGHSWEIEHFGLWKKLEDLFKSINDQFPRKILRYSDLVNRIDV